MSPALLGKQIDGIWHTGIVAYGREYYFGGGICADAPGATPYGTPLAIEEMGTTQKSLIEFRAFLSSISPSFTFATYHLLDNNCNNFSDQCCRFLVGKSIPQYILDLPAEAMNSPLGPMLRPVIEQMQSAIQQQSVGHEVQLNGSSAAGASTRPPLPTTSRAVPTSPSRQYWASPVALAHGDRSVITSKLKEFVPTYNAYEQTLVELSLAVSPHKSFPALDLVRIDVAEKETVAEEFVGHFQQLANRFILNVDIPFPACMMTLRGAVNVFKHASPTTKLCQEGSIETLVECVVEALNRENAPVRKTAAILALNLAGAHRRNSKVAKLGENNSTLLIYSIVQRLASEEPPQPNEARPLLSALIVLVDGDPDALVLVKTFGLDLEAYQNSKTCPDQATRTTASELAKLLAAG